MNVDGFSNINTDVGLVMDARRGAVMGVDEFVNVEVSVEIGVDAYVDVYTRRKECGSKYKYGFACGFEHEFGHGRGYVLYVTGSSHGQKVEMLNVEMLKHY